jgi:F-box/TPR repeat protein Pof3
MIARIISRSVGTRSLKRLDVGKRFLGYNDYIEEVYPASESVTELSLALLTLPEERIMAIVKLYPNLQRLDVSRTQVTGVAIKEFVNAGITWLNCKDCYQTSPDAIEYARGRGVEVEFFFPTRTATFRDNARVF